MGKSEEAQRETPNQSETSKPSRWKASPRIKSDLNVTERYNYKISRKKLSKL